MRFIAACRGNRSTAARSVASDSAPAAVGSRDDRSNLAPGTPTQARRPRRSAPPAMPRKMSDSGPTKTSRPERQVRLERLPGSVAHLHPDEVRGLVAQPPQDVERDGIPARLRELVDVERQRRTRVRGRGEVRELRRLVEGEVRRADDRDRGRTCLGRVGSESDRVGRRLRSAVSGNVEPTGSGLDEEAQPRLRSSTEKSTPSPFVPKARTPSRPAVTYRSSRGPNASSSRRRRRRAAGSPRRRGSRAGHRRCDTPRL